MRPQSLTQHSNIRKTWQLTFNGAQPSPPRFKEGQPGLTGPAHAQESSEVTEGSAQPGQHTALPNPSRPAELLLKADCESSLSRCREQRPSATSLCTPKPRSSVRLRLTPYLVEKDLPDGSDPPSSKRASTPSLSSPTPARKAPGSRSFRATNTFSVSTATAARAAQRRLNEQIPDHGSMCKPAVAQKAHHHPAILATFLGRIKPG
ncbi:hypothetical protein JEQ12_002337 [Ovis aries]|uniref:Uncharacterized protein n=1 Tax=Ovis aries TaxID=9940 RepID=A0A836D050_SHEEP|nr:hypothetical protein JEQ12_002337 [Ovis aries]